MVVIISIVFIICLTLYVSVYFVFNFFRKKKNWDKRLRYVFVLSFIVILGVFYFTIYPLDSFYETEYKMITGLNFPENGQIVYKVATYPDFHGDYTSCFVMSVSGDELNDLEKYLQTEGFKYEKNIWSSSEIDSICKIVNVDMFCEGYILERGSEYCFISILKERDNMILVYRVNY